MQDKIKQQQHKFMLYNLAAFTVIFALFAGIIYSQIRIYLFSPIQNNLSMAQDIIESTPNYVERQLSFQSDAPKPSAQRGGAQKPEGGKQDISIRIQTIVRTADGTVLNPHVLGRIYYEGYLSQIPFTQDQGTSEFQLEDGSAFLISSFTTTDQDGEEYYIQLLSSIDGEQAIITNFTKILVICVIVFVLLSITASYLLSKQTMKPVIRAWHRQVEFVENASHELRTPLTIIQNKLETLLLQPHATIMDRADEIGISLSETRRLSKLTSDLMTLARADSNETQLELGTFPLDDLIREVSEPYRELAALQEKEMTLDLRYGRSITADKARIHELMVILLDNALKYTAPGDSIQIITDEKESKALIVVKDTGIGISEESRQRVFDRFYREDKARSREKGGSGLGLSIAMWIVGAHGGNISLQPNISKGSMIKVLLKK